MIEIQWVQLTKCTIRAIKPYIGNRVSLDFNEMILFVKKVNPLPYMWRCWIGPLRGKLVLHAG